MEPFKSIIVFDSETTNMPKLDHNTTKIVELAFLACEVDHIKESNDIPRVLHKLVLCFCPYKTIHPGATKTSGLSNELLENLQPFRKEDVEMLNHFISRLPPPVVIVAHNGDNFDFPILRRMLSKLQLDLSNNVYCSDSLKAFRNLLPKKHDGETTPKSQKTVPRNILNYKERRALSRTISSTVCRELFPESPSSTFRGFECNNTFITVTEGPVSYKLADIYFYLHNEDFPNSHQAEEDCKALLRCIVRCKGFCDWVNQNAVPFNSIPPLF